MPERKSKYWSLMMFSSGSNNSLASGTVLWKWVHLEDTPLVNAEYAAWGSSCACFKSDWRSFTQLSTLFLMYCSLNESVPITDPFHPRRRSPWSVICHSSFRNRMRVWVSEWYCIVVLRLVLLNFKVNKFCHFACLFVHVVPFSRY